MNRGDIGVGVLADSVGDLFGQFVNEFIVAKHLGVLRVADKGNFYQNRRHFSTYEHLGADMPARFTQTALITNPEHAKKLGDEELIDKLAEQRSDGISQYANANVASVQ